jgi:hypothetical protein
MSHRAILIRRAVAAVLLASSIAATGRAAPPMSTDASVLFLHHSTGGVIWAGGVPGWLAQYDATHATAYSITDMAYPDAPYPWENYPYDYWNLWVQHAGSPGYQGQATLEILTPSYDVIVFKHCFPVSGIGPDTGSPDVASAAKTIENYQLQYAALKAKLRSFPANRFLLWTGAALRREDTTPEQAARARAFFAWVRGTWDEPGDNIYVWDFFSLETDGGPYLTAEHASGDSHPNAGFAAEVAPLFAQRVVDVIEGRGDSTGSSAVPPTAARLSFRVRGPSSGTVTFDFELPRPQRVTLDVFDVAGRHVARVVEGERAAGSQSVTWEPGLRAGGAYVARLGTADGDLARRVLLLR